MSRFLLIAGAVLAGSFVAAFAVGKAILIGSNKRAPEWPREREQ